MRWYALPILLATIVLAVAVRVSVPGERVPVALASDVPGPDVARLVRERDFWHARSVKRTKERNVWKKRTRRARLANNRHVAQVARLRWVVKTKAMDRARCLKACVFYPLPVRGRLVGLPYSGTHQLGNWQSDRAIDLAVPVGTPVFAPIDGRIGSRIGSLGKGGRFAGLRLTLVGRDSFYLAHLSRLYVRAGQRVRAGQLLGLSGRAGIAHLHIAQRHGNVRHTFRAH